MMGCGGVVSRHAWGSSSLLLCVNEWPVMRSMHYTVFLKVHNLSSNVCMRLSCRHRGALVVPIPWLNFEGTALLYQPGAYSTFSMGIMLLHFSTT